MVIGSSNGNTMAHYHKLILSVFVITQTDAIAHAIHSDDNVDENTDRHPFINTDVPYYEIGNLLSSCSFFFFVQ